jgi:hypothetical protein
MVDIFRKLPTVIVFFFIVYANASLFLVVKHMYLFIFLV